EDLLKFEGQGEKSAQNIIDSLEKSKKTTRARFIFGLGIRFVGEQTAKTLADHFQTIEDFLKTDAETLMQIPEIGPKVSDSIIQWLQNKELISDVRLLLTQGIEFEKSTRTETGPFLGLSFVVTGTLPVKRDEAKDFIEKNGGKILSGVSAKLDYLVVGDDPGSKVDKATSLGVQMIDWNELVKMSKQAQTISKEK
ncbi:MAG: helix-hairpin-helix domain-containing protein, partial [Pseudobdellovibrionaceae bacterium]